MPDLRTLFSHAPVLVMGVVNATGDSFSEGAASRPETALDRALRLLDDGADLLDIGGESSRPGAQMVPAEEECARVVPLIRELKRRRPSAVLSIDTRKAAVGRAALEAGAEILNDVSMLRFDPAYAGLAAESGVPLILGHSRGTPQNMREAVFCDYGQEITGTVFSELQTAAAKAAASGVKPEALIYDPNFGFAKTAEQDWQLLKDFHRFTALGPVLAGVSRKSFLGELTGQLEPALRLGSTIAAALYAVRQGAKILRVHEIRQIRDALKVQLFLSGEVA